MTAYAYSVIKEMQDGAPKIYQPGDRLDDLDKERIAHLLEIGAAANYDRTKSTGAQVQDAIAESDQLKNKVAELEAKLAEATKAQADAEKSEAAKSSSTSSTSSTSKPSTSK